MTYRQMVEMRVRAVEERKGQLDIQTEREEGIADLMGWNAYEKGFSTALEMVKSGAIKMEKE